MAGEVVWPGLYVLPAGSRVQDAIFAAHGPTPMADLGRVSLAAPLRDGDRVLVPRIIQPTFPLPPAPPGYMGTRERAMRAAGLPGPAPSADLGPAAPRSPPPVRTPPVIPAPPAGETPQTVNVNTADAAELERLPGIGPVLARRIVEHREAKGLFRRLEDMLEVEGIGPRLLRRLQPLLRLE
ncbi:MAG: helix-hairpin-helix domain-containing protein [Armatimonadetes bacterium]|nr:helix-hairpin-helix domain-containing protein [Armatimonadota bacterium]